MLAYDQAKKFSSRPEKFGSGIPEGIIASEASNNANVAGSLVTIMAFGIPGDAVTAVMLGALTIHGIQSGPLFISQNAQPPTACSPLHHRIRWCHPAFPGCVVLHIIVPKSILFSVVLVLCVVTPTRWQLHSDGYVSRDGASATSWSGSTRSRPSSRRDPRRPDRDQPGALADDRFEPVTFVTRPISLLLGSRSPSRSIWQHRRM
jgi:hypothetical protein